MSVNNTVLASALQRRAKGYLDQISAHIPLFEFMRSKNRYISTNGGTVLEFEIQRLLDTDEHSYADYDSIVITPNDQVVEATANWKQYAAPIVISGEEKRKNTGPTRIFNLLEQKERSALNSLQQQFNVHLYLDGTGNSSKRVTGLDAIWPEDNTAGTLYGIDRSAAGNVFFRGRSVGAVGAALAISTGESLLVDSMHDARVQCGRLKIGGAGDRYPDFGISTETLFRWYEKVLQITGLRFRNTDMGDMGFDSVAYHGMTLMHDEDCPQDAGGAEQMYMLNSAFMELRYHPEANFAPTDMDRHTTQDVFSALLIWMGELLANVPSKGALVHGVTAPA